METSEGDTTPPEVIWEAIGGAEGEEFNARNYNQIKVTPMVHQKAVPPGGFLGSLAKKATADILRQQLAESLEVVPESLSLAYEGKALDMQLTLKDNGVVEPGPSARREGVRVQLFFTLDNDVVPGKLKRAQEAKDAAMAQAEEERKRKLEEEYKLKAQEEEIRRLALEHAKKLQKWKQEHKVEIEGQKKLLRNNLIFRCYGKKESTGFVVNMLEVHNTENLAFALHEALGIGSGEFRLCLQIGETALPPGIITDSGVTYGSVVWYFRTRVRDDWTNCAADAGSVTLLPFNSANEAEIIEGGILSRAFMQDFRTTSGYPYRPLEEEELEIYALKGHQLRGLQAVRCRCKELHFDALPAQEERATKLGFSELDFTRTLEWVREQAPLIIHLNLDKRCEQVAKDTHYRNLFEVRTSGGSSDTSHRMTVEDNLFGSAYIRADHFDRVKYGVLNFTNKPEGVLKCAQYGKDYLLMKRMRLRTTMCSTDSFADQTSGTPDYYAHILAQYSDHDFSMALKVRKPGVQVTADEDGFYKEVQFHGEVRLKDHVDKIVVHPETKVSQENLQLLSEACGGAEILYLSKKAHRQKLREAKLSLRELHERGQLPSRS